MITTLPNSLVAAMNRAQPGSLPSEFAAIQLGTVLRQRLPAKLTNVAPTTDPYAVASNVSIVLPDDAKAGAVLYAYARSGTGTAGPLAFVAGGAPSAGQISISPDGNLIFNAGDAWTSVDVDYMPLYEMAFEVILPVVSGVVTIPPALLVAGTPVCDLYEAQRNDTSTAMLQVTAPAAANSTTGTACLSLDKMTSVFLDSADGATSVRLKFGIAYAAGADLNKLLEAVSSFI